MLKLKLTLVCVLASIISIPLNTDNDNPMTVKFLHHPLVIEMTANLFKMEPFKAVIQLNFVMLYRYPIG